MHQSNVRGRWLGAVTLLAGSALATAIVGGGCGGKTNDAGTTPDPDTGTVVVDSAGVDSKPAGDTALPPKDTGPAKPDTTGVDTEPSYDAPGSLFDAVIPDVVFDGGKTAAGCYDCATSKCHDELAACDSDARCRGFLLCVLVVCKGSTTDTTCLLGCASDYDVMSFSDPIVKKVQAIVACQQANCKDACPGLPVDGGPPTDAPGTETTPTDAFDDGAADAAVDADAMTRASGPHKPLMSIDPAVVTLMRDVQASFEAQPLVRDGVVDQLSAH
ncbi:MAG: hypothetical protein NVS3B10_03900 [Polyangiales bacterium]